MKWQTVRANALCALLCCLLVSCSTKTSVEASAQGQWLAIALDTVEVGAPINVGSFDFSGGRLRYDVTAQKGSGLFVGVYPEDTLPDGKVTWERYIEGGILPFVGDEKSIQVSEGVSDLSGKYYVYVGSSETNLSDVSGTIQYASAES